MVGIKFREADRIEAKSTLCNKVLENRSFSPQSRTVNDGIDSRFQRARL
jgi:hypothetical protein